MYEVEGGVRYSVSRTYAAEKRMRGIDTARVCVCLCVCVCVYIYIYIYIYIYEVEGQCETYICCSGSRKRFMIGIDDTRIQLLAYTHMCVYICTHIASTFMYIKQNFAISTR